MNIKLLCCITLILFIRTLSYQTPMNDWYWMFFVVLKCTLYVLMSSLRLGVYLPLFSMKLNQLILNQHHTSMLNNHQPSVELNLIFDFDFFLYIDMVLVDQMKLMIFLLQITSSIMDLINGWNLTLSSTSNIVLEQYIYLYICLPNIIICTYIL